MPPRLEARAFASGRVRRSVLRTLRDNVLCSLATVTPRNRAHISTAYFAYSEDLELFFLSDPASLHARNLGTNRSMAVAVFGSHQSWGGPDRGLQLSGRCSEAKDRHGNLAKKVYAKRFPEYRKWVAELEEAGKAQPFLFYRFVPGRLKILDEAEFGDGIFVEARIRRVSRGRA